MRRERPEGRPRQTAAAKQKFYREGYSEHRGIADYLLDHRGVPGDAVEARMHRRISDWIQGRTEPVGRWS